MKLNCFSRRTVSLMNVLILMIRRDEIFLIVARVLSRFLAHGSVEIVDRLVNPSRRCILSGFSPRLLCRRDVYHHIEH